MLVRFLIALATFVMNATVEYLFPLRISSSMIRFYFLIIQSEYEDNFAHVRCAKKKFWSVYLPNV